MNKNRRNFVAMMATTPLGILIPKSLQAEPKLHEPSDEFEMIGKTFYVYHWLKPMTLLNTVIINPKTAKIVGWHKEKSEKVKLDENKQPVKEIKECKLFRLKIDADGIETHYQEKNLTDSKEKIIKDAIENYKKVIEIKKLYVVPDSDKFEEIKQHQYSFAFTMPNAIVIHFI